MSAGVAGVDALGNMLRVARKALVVVSSWTLSQRLLDVARPMSVRYGALFGHCCDIVSIVIDIVAASCWQQA